MFARVITAQAGPQGFDSFIGLAEEQLPGASQQPGFEGFYVLTNAETGKVMIMSGGRLMTGTVVFRGAPNQPADPPPGQPAAAAPARRARPPGRPRRASRHAPEHIQDRPTPSPRSAEHDPSQFISAQVAPAHHPPVRGISAPVSSLSAVSRSLPGPKIWPVL
jgi:hypothetical protein